MKGTIYAIRDHFLVVLALISADLILKAVLHFGTSLLDAETIEEISYILAKFLVGVVLIFSIVSCLELFLHGLKNLWTTFNRLFRPTKQTSSLAVQNSESQ